MTDYDVLRMTGRRLTHPLEKALAEGNSTMLLGIIREFGIPASWDCCCATFDKKVEDKTKLVDLAFCLVSAIKIGLVDARSLRNLCLTLINTHLVFNSHWKEDRTIRVLSIAIEAQPHMLDDAFKKQIVLASLRSESSRLFALSGYSMQSVKPHPDFLFALCEGRGTLLDVVFTPIRTWTPGEKQRVVKMFMDVVIREKTANESQEIFLGTLHDRGIGGEMWITPSALKSASVRNVVHSRKISLKAEDVLGLPQKYRLEFCLARLISATDAKIKEKLLEGVLAEDLGL